MKTIVLMSLIGLVICTYDIGIGLYDITGPAAEINMMGYGKINQVTTGIHMRLFARTFIIGSEDKRICFVTIDTCMVSQAIKMEVNRRLLHIFNGQYNEKNVILTATHTHSSPGGYFQYVFYSITSQGFIRQNFEVIVDGIIKSIILAHGNMKKGKILYNSGILTNTSINRSPTAYLANPPEERQNYESDTDQLMEILKFVDESNKPLGVISFFPIHPTSMNHTNQLISGDNKGYASYLFEQKMNPDSLPGKGEFVSAFANTNLGDVSPNIKGPRCIGTDVHCDIETSTCLSISDDGSKEEKSLILEYEKMKQKRIFNRRIDIPIISSKKNDSLFINKKCIASGPGNDMFESTKKIGQNQYKKAYELFESAETEIVGPVSYIHQHVDMSNFPIFFSEGNVVNTCKPAMGASFAAGTIDGPGNFDFQQGATTLTPFWNAVRIFIRKPSRKLIDCHQPKPILLATGEMKFPYDWQPSIVPTQIIRIGQIIFVAVPGELTTMAGRRLRNAIYQEFENLKSDKMLKVILVGLSNAYTSYITTYEEYQKQRYEGASTIYGPNTLAAYINQYRMLARHLVIGDPLSPGPEPPNLINRQMSFKTNVIYDGAMIGKSFGSVLYDVKSSYTYGEVVVVVFVAANPRNDLRIGDTFLRVERITENGLWITVATDASWETRFFWRRTNMLAGESQVIITWQIPENIKPGIYRIRYFGSYKNLLTKPKSFEGRTSEFTVQ